MLIMYYFKHIFFMVKAYQLIDLRFIWSFKVWYYFIVNNKYLFGMCGFLFHKVLFGVYICLCVIGLTHVWLSWSFCCIFLLCVIDTSSYRIYNCIYIECFSVVFWSLFFRNLFMWESILKCLPTDHFHSRVSILFLFRSRDYKWHVYMYIYIWYK